jgi:lipopolysaccharide transport system ATP-binding protein
MSDFAIKTENLSKLYQIGSSKGGSIRDLILEILKPDINPLKTEFWAIKDLSIEIKKGEVLGVIGSNGAGKSTLLKLLSRITVPTEGRIKINGRISSLLEVGTGFHPELSGRENIILNGTILGMSRQEIRSKFDEVIAFSGVEKFIDTPVKHYSSGMYVRLAFAVAAHLEPEILIVDEVLAVGDTEFQKKCLGKMKDVAQSGKTVLFVSHSIQSIKSLCTLGLLLDHGRMVSYGNINSVISDYLSADKIAFNEFSSSNNESYRRGNGKARFAKITLKNSEGVETNNFGYRDTIRINFQFILNEEIHGDLYFGFALRSENTKEIIMSSRIKIPKVLGISQKRYNYMVDISSPVIRPGIFPTYYALSDGDNDIFDIIDDYLPALNINASGTKLELGFDPSKFAGYFSEKLDNLKKLD